MIPETRFVNYVNWLTFVKLKLGTEYEIHNDDNHIPATNPTDVHVVGERPLLPNSICHGKGVAAIV